MTFTVGRYRGYCNFCAFTLFCATIFFAKPSSRCQRMPSLGAGLSQRSSSHDATSIKCIRVRPASCQHPHSFHVRWALLRPCTGCYKKWTVTFVPCFGINDVVKKFGVPVATNRNQLCYHQASWKASLAGLAPRVCGNTVSQLPTAHSAYLLL